MTDPSKKLSLQISAELSPQDRRGTKGSKRRSSVRLIIVLIGIALILRWCSAGPKKPETWSEEWFVAHPRDAKEWDERCTPVNGMRTADDIRWPEACLNASKAVEVLRRK